ncbi:MAG: hypothetical protein A3A57_00625 [Candidatus Woykebacteria bacterium RIFCSPLOWO2_01_FULL_41_12]|uniref:Transcription-repair-coupling factor n=1 Tax=Candidatus Woykebacteria bacterium RIFCSPLOWO2_01_FULL_41_12 TaxID=1802604 RepID=A0A1G1WYE0_9BACT|nr:MAG: hypothetical protein A3A57_00625 [Candidatus Woykebacteria bacterium RIFCSPLOWO2_01_FULL_41_12]
MKTDQLEKTKLDKKEKIGISVGRGNTVSFSHLRNKLIDLGYTNVSPGNVAKIGEFSIRGGVVDIWLERYKLPARIDLIGSEVESLYLFNTLTQEKTKLIKEIYIVPFGITPKLGPKWSKKFPVKEHERLFLSEIKPGDLVVHIDYGIGKFVDIKTNGQQQLVVEYLGNDRLYVPIEQIDRLTKYIGASGRRPQVSKLGSATWERIKQKVQDDVVAYAKELLELYAQREIVNRPPLGKDTPWQRELEESFEFTDTDDQIKTLRMINKDLESERPMDRLLVGDVGYGKTEVSIRTAFKMVQESRQVAVLVPTTILADQHFFVFSDRLKKFPVKISLLSRFKGEEEQKKILEALQSGEMDIVIGTHRLFSSDVQFKNLGLLIIDEEHRFGVHHKEKLKIIRPAVDVLSMSATPIPRSLQMALVNIRDMSVLDKPPIGRKPIETFVGQYSNEKIRLAIQKEINRGGQVYFVFNNVAKIAGKANEIAALMPAAKIVYAHGQMDGKQLESAMSRFYSGNANVLVCTTIIGSGIDMPGVNTIIIENADKFGLADLYQLRGRVGRSVNESFAYLFYPKNYVPEGMVLERLSAISQATKLGSGFKIARQDLEIRGAGNLLGTAQSGNIALVGFELYVQLLAQTVEKLKLTAKQA